MIGIHATAERRPARAGEPVVDPAGWRPDDIAATDDWAYHLSGPENDEVAAAVAAVERQGIDIVDITKADFPLPRLGAVLAEAREELRFGRGFAYLRGMDVDGLGPLGSAIAFFGIGSWFGRALSQNAEGHVLGHVEDLGKDYDDPMVRGYQTSAAMNFHTDQCDYVALLCMREARSGGAARIASSVTIYNEMLRRRPEFAAALASDFYWTRHGEIPPGQPPWYKLPIFSFVDGYFSGRGIGAHVSKAVTLPGVPPFTETQTEAIALYRTLARELAADIDFRKGDLQFLCNHVVVHSRTAFDDWPEPERKRHLYRLWLSDPDARPLPHLVRRNFSGIEVEGFRPKAPLTSREPA